MIKKLWKWYYNKFVSGGMDDISELRERIVKLEYKVDNL